MKLSIVILVCVVACSDDREGGIDGVLHFDAAMISSDGGADAPPLDSGTDASVDAASDTRNGMDAPSDVGVDASGSALFVPDIEITYDGSFTDPGMEITAFTIAEDPFSFAPDVLVAIRGTTAGLNLCSLDLTITYFNAAGGRVGISRGLVETPLYRGSGGSGGLLRCVGAGETAMQTTTLELDPGWTVDDISSATWENGALNVSDAVPTGDVTVTGLTAVPDGSRIRFSGSVVNGSSSESIRSPSVAVFGVNVAGRPLFAATDLEIITVPPFGSWSFDTLSVPDQPYVGEVVFVDARTP